jgi:hypothetical protein
MSLDYSRLVVGYHGTDERTARHVLAGNPLRASQNDYDWLGTGIYFWEQGPSRAYEFACEIRKLRRTVRRPAVLGAYINLGDCLDLLDQRNTELLGAGYQVFKNEFRGIKNERRRHDGTKLFHRLDCAVINALVIALESTGDRRIDTVRGCFFEGPAAFPGAEIRRKSHVQIAVRNPGCVLGYFRPVKGTSHG